jgi:hypothetical protein
MLAVQGECRKVRKAIRACEGIAQFKFVSSSIQAAYIFADCEMEFDNGKDRSRRQKGILIQEDEV